MTTKTVTLDDITGEIIDPKQINTIELRVTSGPYAGASVELDLSAKSFESKIMELLDHGDLEKILAVPKPAADDPVKKARRPRHNYTYIHEEIEPEDLVPVLANHRIQLERRNSVAIDARLYASVMSSRSYQVRIRQSFRLSNITELRDQLNAVALDLVIHKTFRSVSNGKVLGVFGDIYAVPNWK